MFEVLILVLVEDGLEDPNKGILRVDSPVLILVLVEDGLEGELTGTVNLIWLAVLILVLVEDGLEDWA